MTLTSERLSPITKVFSVFFGNYPVCLAKATDSVHRYYELISSPILLNQHGFAYWVVKRLHYHITAIENLVNVGGIYSYRESFYLQLGVNL